ncbi:MAG TPA: sulfite oxidase [Acidimicrobiales bacterium]|nr:sulfite oxidase [Acidimicrobiales bacterium]
MRMTADHHVRRRAAVGGLVAAGLGLALTELFAGLWKDVPSPVAAIGDVFIDGLPGWAVRAGIDQLGTGDKPFLVSVIVVLTLLLGWALGGATRHRRWIGPLAFGVAGLFGAWATVRDPLSDAFPSILATLLPAAIGAAALLLLVDRAEATAEQPTVSPAAAGANRRRFLIGAGGTAVFALFGAAIGRRLAGRHSVEGERGEVALPDVEHVSVAEELETPGLTPYLVPNEDFYRIDTALTVPQISPEDWTLRITGMVDEELELTFDDLLGRDQVEEIITLSCVSNEIGGDLVGNARWQGVLLADLLEEAGVQDGAEQVVGISTDGFTAGFPLEVATDGRPCLVAFGMNGEPLPVVHGFPARLVIPGLYGYVSATKWLSEIRLTTWEGFDGYWIPRGWAKEGPIKTQSRIDVPRPGASLTAGRQPIAGVAWAPTRGITKVEVQVDDGEWQEARLGDETNDLSWRQWVLEWDAPTGEHEIRVRATDGDGETQTEEIARPDPDGATGWHTISVEVD